MKKSNWLDQQSILRILMAAGVIALAVAFVVALPQPASADNITPPPPVPTNLQVPAGNKLFLVGHAEGTQNYVCLPSGSGFAWTLFTPQATLFDSNKEQLITHFFSPPNPAIPGVQFLPTWEDSRDTSMVWAKLVPGDSSNDPNFVDPNAIAWFKLTVTGTQDGPTGGDRLSATTFIQRLNTGGGKAPSTGCSVPENLGSRAYIPYTADYYFYKSSGG